MPILIFNRRLAWVVAAVLLWSLAGLTLALGNPPPRRPQEQPPLRFSVGPPPGGLWLPGDVSSIVEEPDQLVITLALPPGARRDMRGARGERAAQLPPGLKVQFIDSLPAGEPPGPPEIMLKSGPAKPIVLPGGRLVTLTEQWVVKYGSGGVRIIQRTPEMNRERLKRWLRWEEQQPPAPGAGQRPGEKRPPLKRWQEKRGEDGRRSQPSPGE